MTQSERREYLIQYLLKEDKKIFKHKMPADKTGQEQLLRSLMNVRLPKPISEDFLKIQDEYLKERNRERYHGYCKFKIGCLGFPPFYLAGRHYDIKM